MPKKYLVIMFLVLSVVILGAGAYFLSVQKQNEESEGIKIAASIFPTYDIARNITGDKAEVVQVIPAGASPHTFEPTVSDKEKLAGTDVFFAIGLEFDHWAEGIVKDESAEIVDLSEGINLHASEEHEEEAEHEEEDHDHGEFDPHYWLSPENAKTIAAEIADKLAEIDPENSEYYQENLESYTGELNALQQESTEKLADVTTREFITFHDAFGYLAEDFDLEVIATIEPYAGKEPTPAYLSEVVDTIEEHDVKVLYSEPQLSEGVVSALADDYGIEIFTLDPLGGVDGRDSYIELISYNVNILAQSLDK